MLCPLSVVLCGVELRSLNFGGESLKVCLDDVGGAAAACGGSGWLACSYPFPASPPARLSSLSHNTQDYGTPACLLLRSHEDSDRKSTCAPGACFDRRGGDCDS